MNTINPEHEKEILALIDGVRTLAYFYNNFIYEGHENSLSVEYTEKIGKRKLNNILSSYFIDKLWNTQDTWKKLDLVQKEKFICAANSFSFITALSIDDKNKLISFDLPFIISKKGLSAAYKLLKEGNLAEYRKLFPAVTLKAIYDEVEIYTNILMHLALMVDVNIP